MAKSDMRCPIRDNEPCTLCQAYVTGPADCGLVYIVMNDEELRELYRAQRAKLQAAKKVHRIDAGETAVQQLG